MRIQHNIAALNSYRQLGGNNNAVSKNLEKLSSGYRINRAGDDAAGLAISEKMRAQIKGLETAQKNANDGISLVQTAEGALTEVHSMLNRMVELATQSANGTYDVETDRANLQKEVVSLKAEIDRIAESTNYNGIKLLDGSLGVTSGGEIVDGSKVSYLDGLDTETIAAKANKFGFDLAAGNPVTTGSLDVANGEVITITYSNGKGQNRTATLTNSTGATAKLEDLYSTADAEFRDLFTMTAGGITTKVAGAGQASISSITGASLGTVVSDPNASITGADAKTAFKLPTGSTTFTIGDKTFQTVTAGATAAKGNIEIKMVGANATANEIVNALKSAGITSASETLLDDGTTAAIQITDEKQMQVDAKGVAVSVDGNAGAIVASKATKNEFTITDKSGSGNQEKMTLNFIDKNGTAQSIEVSYNSVKATAASAAAETTAAAANTQQILNALAGNAEFNKNFELDGTTIKAKDAGSSGAKIAGFSTTDSTVVNGDSKINFTSVDGKDALKTLDMKEISAGTKVTVNGKTFEFVQDGKEAAKGNIAVTIDNSGGATGLNTNTKNLVNALKAEGINATYAGGSKIEFSNSGQTLGEEGKGLVLQVGDTSDDYQKVTVKVGSMSVKSLGIDSVDIGTQEGASAALDKIRAAINKVSSTRGDLGAIQNRLDHTINNLGVATENMTAAESRIRDTDMASEMMTFTKNNILTQAAQAMLAQANQIPQGVLQLLQ